MSYSLSLDKLKSLLTEANYPNPLTEGPSHTLVDNIQNRVFQVTDSFHSLIREEREHRAEGFSFYPFCTMELNSHQDQVLDFLRGIAGTASRVEVKGCKVASLPTDEVVDFLVANENLVVSADLEGLVTSPEARRQSLQDQLPRWCQTFSLVDKKGSPVATMVVSYVSYGRWSLRSLVFKKGFYVQGGSSKLFKAFCEACKPSVVDCHEPSFRTEGTSLRVMGFEPVGVWSPSAEWYPSQIWRCVPK